MSGPVHASNDNIYFSYWLGASNILRFVLLNSVYIDIPAQSGNWYKVELKNVNYSTRRYDLYVNDALIQSNVPFRSTSISSVGSFRIYSFNSSTNYYDNIMMGNQSIDLSASVVNETCGQLGSIDLTSSLVDGTTYQWSNGATTEDLTNLSSGTYTVHVTNGTCFNTLINQVGSAQQFNSSFSASACTPYSWNNEVFTTSGTYVRTLQSSGGCDSIVTMNLTMSAPITAVDVQTACSPFQWIDGNTYVSNNFSATHTLLSVNGCDSIVTLNLTYTPPLTGDAIVQACGEFLWIDGNTYTENNYTANYTIPSLGGCDSLVTLNLTITNLEAEMQWDGVSLSVTESENAIYQWFDCSNNQPISGANSFVFTPTVGGNYRVGVTNGPCYIETECMAVSGLSLSAVEVNAFSIHPNPSRGNFNIQSEQKMKQVTVLNMEGKSIEDWKVNDEKEWKLSLSHLSNGIYLIQVELENGSVVNQKVIKE